MNEILEVIHLCIIEVTILGNNVEFINSSKYVESGKINELLDRVMGIDPPMAVRILVLHVKVAEERK